MSQESAMHEEIEDLSEALKAAKLREAELTRLVSSQGIRAMQDLDNIETLAQERDAALSVFPAIRVKLVSTFGGMGPGSSVWGQTQYDKGYSAGVLAALTAFDTAVKQLPASAALAERDRNATACDPEILSGTPCLYGTRIPMTMLAAEVKQDGAAAVIADRHLPCTAECLETAVARFAEWLAERDRAIREECATWLYENRGRETAMLFRREFGLEPKTEGV